MLYSARSTILSRQSPMLVCMGTKGDRIKEARKSTGLDQPALARLVGVTKQAVSHWETGRTKDIKNMTFARISEVTGYSARWLATGQGPKKEKGGAGISSESGDLVRKIETLTPDERAVIRAVVERLAAKRA